MIQTILIFLNDLTGSPRCPIIQKQSERPPMKDEMLTRCVVDPIARKFYLYSSLGTEKQVSCETVNQFMNVLELVRSLLDENTLAYANPL
jgi:hypothetical protein